MKNHLMFSVIRRYMGIVCLLMSALPLSAQDEQRITGMVMDVSDMPVIGAGVVVDGTTYGAVTSVDGTFVLDVPSGSTLVVSCLGYQEQRVTVVPGQNVYNVVLSDDSTLLDETVVVGYGNLPKRSVTTAVSSMKTDNIENMPVGTLGESLYGQLPGLYVVQSSGQPGADVSLRIRGSGSLTASSDPLYVIDGFPTNDASLFSNLAAEDIENISILKDAASAAIYGSRAGNGVILVTTKKSKNGKPVISMTVQGGIQQPQRYIDVLNAEEFALMVKDARAAQGMPELALLDDPSQWVVTDWQKDVFFRTAPYQRYNVAVRGSSDRVRYSISGQYQSQDGIVQNSFHRRLGAKSDLEIDVTDWMTVGLSIAPTYTRQRVQNTSGGNTTVTQGTVTEAVTYPPIFGPWMPDGDYFQIQQHTQGTDFNSELTNPLSKLLEINNDYEILKTLSRAFVRMTPLRGLVVNSEISVTTTSQKNEYYRSAYSPGSSRTGNKSTPNLAAIDAYRQSGFNYNWYWSTTATFTREFGNHNLVAMAGYDVAYNSGYSVRQDDRTDASYPVAYGNNVITNVNGAYIWNGSSSFTEYAFDAVFARLNYDYAGRYVASASIRRDRSSKFGPDNRAGLFWSVSGAWNIAEESFMQNMDWLNVAKLRASYGVTGNDNIGNNYVWTSTLVSDQYVFGQGTGIAAVTGYYPGGYSNRRLGWETNTQVDVGIDIGLFDRLSITLDWYNRISDVVLSASIPNLNGKSGSVTMNAGMVRNRGLEVQISSPVIDNEDFGWLSTFNISFNRNKLLSLATGNDYYGSANGMLRNYVGRPLGDIYLYVNDGVFIDEEDVANSPKYNNWGTPGDLKFKDVDGSGDITVDDMVYVGNNMPKFNAGWINTFRYRNWELSLVLDGQYGGLIYWGFGYSAGLNRHMENSFAIYARDRWRSPEQPGDGISQRAAGNVQLALMNQTRYLFKSDYLKIRNLSVAYNVPSAICDKIGLDGLKLSLSGQNLFSFDEYPGYSVEAGGMGGATGGSDSGNYPAVRTVTLGLNLLF